MICKSGQFKINLKSNRKPVYCLSNGSDGENLGTPSTTRARKFCTHWSLAKSLLAMLFGSELQ